MMKILTNSTPLGLFLIYFLVMSLGGIHAQCGVNESEHPGNFTFSASGGTTIVPIESAGTNCNYSSWQFSSNAGWVSVSLVNSNSMLIDCDPNTSNVDRTATVTITDNGEQMTFQVKSNAPLPPVPSTTLSIIDNCSTATLSRSGSPPLDILWYWQTTSSGISTLFSGQTYTATVPNSTYYLRAYNTNTKKWSNGSVSIMVNTIQTPTTYYVDSDNDGLRDPGSVGQQDCDFRGTGWTTNTSVDNCPDQYDPSNNCILAPPQPGSENTYNNCSSSVDLFAISENPPNGLTHIWYLNPTGPSQLTVSQITVMEDNQLEYITKVTVYQSESYWVASRSSSGQESERTEVKATFTTTDTTPPSLVLGPEDIPSPCGPTATFDIGATGGGPGSIYRWYETSNTSGTPIFTGADYSPTLNYNDTNNGSKTYWVRATLTSSNCYSGPDVNDTESIIVSFQDPVPAPIAANQSFCGPNNFTLTASGAPSGGQYWWYNPDGSTAQISTSNSFSTGTITSTRTYQVSILVNGCEGPKVSVTASIAQIPSSPILGNVAQATCNNAYGTFDITNYNASYTYSVNPSSGVSIDGSTITAPSGMTYTLTAGNGSCSSAPSSSVSLASQPSTPDIPELEIQSQPTCSVGTGSFVITNYNSANTYGISPDIGVSRTGGTFTAPPGIYTVVAVLGECSSAVSNSLTIDGPPSSQTWYSDLLDDDGLGDPNNILVQCGQPEGYVLDASDSCPGIYDPSNACIPLSADPSDHNYIYVRTYQYESPNVVAPNRFVQNDTLLQEITYFDGLGRPAQHVAIAQTPEDKRDIVTHIGYDPYGRQEREWLPYADLDPLSDVGGFRPGALTEVNTYYIQYYGDDILEGSPNPYSQKKFEPSPLNRVLKQGAPGSEWALLETGDDHSIGFGYATNTTDEVRMFTVGTDLIGSTYVPTLEFIENAGGQAIEHYTSGELYKTITYDENHPGGQTKDHTVEEFTDKQGRVVLKRTYAGELPHDTYYVYDDFGNLTYVLPPKMDATSATLATLEGQLDELGYQYVYDHRNRLVEKKIPGKGWEHIVYNKLDQPIMTQDSVQREYGQWLFTKYDALGRVAYTGKAIEMGSGASTPREAVQANADNAAGEPWVVTGSGYSMHGITVGYGNTAYPTTTVSEVLTVNYYDDYAFLVGETGFTVPSMVFNDVDRPIVNHDNTDPLKTKGLPTGSRVKVLGEDGWITTATHYDGKGRAVYTQSVNGYLGTTDIVETELDFVGRPLRVRSSHTRGAETVATLDNFEYDHVGRLLRQTQCIGDEYLGYGCNGTPVDADLVLSGGGTYNSDQLATNSITISGTATVSGTATLRVSPTGGGSGGEEELIAYNKYDDLGQLVQKKVGGTPGTTYALTDGLQTVDYAYNVRGWLKSINDPANLGSDLFAFGINYNDPVNFGANEDPDALYNGNISQVVWKTASVNNTGNLVSERYSYGYDALNRITSGNDNTGNYDLASVSYDRNGNIMALVRDGWQNGSFPNMDVLDYDYFNSEASNRLYKVRDTGNGAYGFKDSGADDQDYWYDGNGNMTRDDNKDITSISYNHLNLPTNIATGSGTISYVYDAVGTKLQKTAGSSVTLYAGNYVYSGNDTAQILQFFSTPEGYVTPDGMEGYDYVYQYKDHLGNVRLSYADSNNDGQIDASTEIISEKNYYPFGLEHKGYNNVVSPNANGIAEKFKYNGIELEESLGLDLYEMEFRQYDPAIARFTSIDPVTHFDYSTYSAFDNNPVFWADPSGANATQFIMDLFNRSGSGETKWTNNNDGTFSSDDGQTAETPKHQFYGVNITGDVMNLSFDNENFDWVTGYGEDPTGLYKAKVGAFYSAFKGMSKVKQLKLLKRLGVPLKLAKKITGHPVSPMGAISSMTRAEQDGLKALPVIGEIVAIATSDFESDGRAIDNMVKWDNVRDGFDNMISTEVLNDVILIYSNTNLFSETTINTNETELSDSRYPQSDYKYVYYGTQYGDTLHIFGRYDNPLRE